MPREIVIEASDIRTAVEGTRNLAKQYRSVLTLAELLEHVAALEQYIDDTNLAAAVARRQLEQQQQALSTMARTSENQIQRWETAKADALERLKSAEAKLGEFEANAKVRTESATAELQRIEAALNKARSEAAEMANRLVA